LAAEILNLLTAARLMGHRRHRPMGLEGDELRRWQEFMNCAAVNHYFGDWGKPGMTTDPFGEKGGWNGSKGVD
jgi:hypothetical protein